VRRTEDRTTEPTAAIVDSQSVRAADTVGAGSRGWDGGKVSGRKRHLVVGCLGLALVVLVTAASVQDRDAVRPVLEDLRRLHRTVTRVRADGGYAGWLVEWAALQGIDLTVVKRSDGMSGFAVLPRRWVVERTLAWLMHNARAAPGCGDHFRVGPVQPKDQEPSVRSGGGEPVLLPAVVFGPRGPWGVRVLRPGGVLRGARSGAVRAGRRPAGMTALREGPISVAGAAGSFTQVCVQIWQ
jgi:transposase